jgi:hypothetical protein
LKRRYEPRAAEAARGFLLKTIVTPVESRVAADHKIYNKPTVEKLGVKPGFKVALLGSPRGFAATLAPWPAKVKLTARAETDADIYICFAKLLGELQAHLLGVRDAERQTLWLAWPKKASGIKTELDGNVVRETGLRAGWVDFKVCALDDTWSCLAFKKRKKEPASFLRQP